MLLDYQCNTIFYKGMNKRIIIEVVRRYILNISVLHIKEFANLNLQKCLESQILLPQ